MFIVKENVKKFYCTEAATLARVSYLIKLRPEACNFIKKEALAQAFSCEFCEISENTFRRTHLVAASYCRKVIYENEIYDKKEGSIFELSKSL